MTQLTLYFSPGASSMAVHIALYEAGAAFEAKPVSLTKKEQREDWFLALNPQGQVPVLVIDGRPLTEVAACLFYIARSFPDAKLFPGDAESKAQIVSWMSFVAATVHPARRQGIEAVTAVYEIAEKKLAGRDWATGKYSIADIHLFRLFWRASNAFPLPRDKFPALFGHYDRMMRRPAVKKTIEVESAVGYHLPA